MYRYPSTTPFMLLFVVAVGIGISGFALDSSNAQQRPASWPTTADTEMQKRMDEEFRRGLHQEVHRSQPMIPGSPADFWKNAVQQFNQVPAGQTQGSSRSIAMPPLSTIKEPKANKSPNPLVPINATKAVSVQAKPKAVAGQAKSKPDQVVPVVSPSNWNSRQRPADRPVRQTAGWNSQTGQPPVVSVNSQQDRDEQQLQQQIARGQSAFNQSCTDCHDADRSLKKNKSFSAWLTTVKRMSEMEDAEISRSDFVPIARYLASLGSAGQSGMDDSGDTESQTPDLALNDGLGFHLSSTISPLYRGSDFTNVVENPGIFVDAWISMDFDRGGALKGKVTVCTSCHSQQGFTFEIVEATAKLDLMKAFFAGCQSEDCEPRIHAQVEAGRFVVPFGGLVARSHPGIYRTLTLPLMYNMGRRVFGNLAPPFRQPVLPMPFADEGINTEVEFDLACNQSIKLDVYATNGLQDGPGGPFTASRRYYDNNELPAYGGRIAIGGRNFKIGGSAMTGDYNVTGGLQRTYEIYGVDAMARLSDMVRYNFEYAIRDEDALFLPGSKDVVYGIVNELEIKLLEKVNLLARYDTLEFRDNLFGPATLKRFTWGVNANLPGGSFLIINHEHWMFPDPQDDVDVIGARWVGAF